MILDRFQELRKKVDLLNPNTKIVVASKTQSIDSIEKLKSIGQFVFGENKLQEAKEKWESLPDLEWHFIGHLQSKKAKEVVENCDLIHSVDRDKLLKAIDKAARELGKTQDILIQVNTSGEENKSGVSPDSLIDFISEASSYSHIKIKGLMTMAHQDNTAELAEKSFKLLKSLLDDVNSNLGLELNELSMGMSSDYELAIKNGATMIRPGSIIFGCRK